ncbi:MAG: hypothetical protein GC168_01940 [Candidatus Hydrogenedens sp.]|nr:hypothetical protein [Candidatus Hydrogenedens sp.]
MISGKWRNTLMGAVLLGCTGAFLYCAVLDAQQSAIAPPKHPISRTQAVGTENKPEWKSQPLTRSDYIQTYFWSDDNLCSKERDQRDDTSAEVGTIEEVLVDFCPEFKRTRLLDILGVETDVIVKCTEVRKRVIGTEGAERETLEFHSHGMVMEFDATNGSLFRFAKTDSAIVSERDLGITDVAKIIESVLDEVTLSNVAMLWSIEELGFPYEKEIRYLAREKESSNRLLVDLHINKYSGRVVHFYVMPDLKDSQE